MAITNHERVGKALQLLKIGLGPFVEREFKAKYGDGWAFGGKDILSDTRLGRVRANCITTLRPPDTTQPGEPEPATAKPTRFHGTAILDPTRVGRDASRIADEVIAHLVGLVGATVTVSIEVQAEIPDGAPDHVVRTVTENSRTLKFTSHGFEKE